MLSFQCKVCNVGVNTAEQLKLHEGGQKHQKRLKQLQLQQSNIASGLASPSSPPGSLPGNPFWCDVCRVSCESAMLLAIHKQGLPHKQRVIAGGDYNTQLQRSLEQMSLELPSNRCTICDVDCNTYEQLQIHKQGSQHQRKMALKQPRNSSVNDYRVDMVNGCPQFTCTVCNIFCNTLEQLQNHQRGAAHFKRQQMLASIQASVQSKSLPCMNSELPRQRSTKAAEDVSSARIPDAISSFDRSPGGAVRGNQPRLASSTISTNSPEFVCCKCGASSPDRKQMVTHICSQVKESAWPTIPDVSELRSRDMDNSDASSIFTASSDSTQLPLAPSPTKPGVNLISQPSASDFLSSRTERRSTTPVFDAALLNEIVVRTQDEHEILCRLCNLTCNTPAAMEAHLSGGKHKKRASRFAPNLASKALPMETPTATVEPQDEQDFVVNHGNGMFECRVCCLKINSNNMESHLAGKQHAEKLVKALRAPAHPVLRPPILRAMNFDNYRGTDATVKTKLSPRSYQWELFVKAMAKDVVVYLPTGTGKTLVAAMVMGEMLNRNPNYQAVFLAEKTLLVLQQSEFLREQLSDTEVKRLNWNTKRIEKRKIRIASLCGDLADLGSKEREPLWKQDIIVTTVGFYLNLLTKQVVRMEDICMIVIDEVHHCVKEHPFHKLMREYHKPIAPEISPKILGLTASPAGATSFNETVTQLKELLANLGNINIVATEHAIDELTEHMSSSKIQCYNVKMEPTERNLQQHLILFATNLLSLVLAKSPIVASLRKELESQTPNWEVIPKMVEQLMKLAEKKDEFAANIVLNCLNGFHKLDAGGWELAADEIEDICRESEKIQRKYPTLKPSLQHLQSSRSAILVSNASGLQISQMMNTLVELVRRGVKKYAADNQMVIVLTSQRSVARSVTDYIRTHTTRTDGNQQVNAICLVGHGSTSGTKQKSELGDRGDLVKGMTVQQQRKALNEIKKMCYNVIVATSVAEEGMDMPACGLVILLTPPNTLTAIVQMRGRARLKDSNFVVLCREAEQRSKFESLIQRENNMFMAVKEVCREQANPAAVGFY